MTELATAYISIVAETSQIPRQVKAALGQAQRDANTAGRDTGRSFASSFGTSLKGLGAAVGVTGGVAAVGAAMKSAISSGMDFTTSLNSMRAVAGATSQQVAQVGAMARQLGNDNSIASTSSVDAAQAMLELAKGGFSVNQSMQAARGTLQLAAAAQISAGEAATIQSQALQAFGLNANQAGMAADILANSANQSSAEITDVAQALQQSGSVAHQFGISMNDTAAAISLMANSGIQGSDAGTLLKSALLALTDQGAPAQSAMKELGVTAYDAQGKFVGLSSLFGQLQTASKNMSAEQYQAATATLFGSDAMRIAGIAAQQGKSGFDAMAAAMGKQGAAADVAAAKMQGLPGAWERFKNAAQDAGLAFYDAVKGPLTAAANWGAEAIGKIVDGASGVGAKIREIFASFQDAGGADLMAQWGDRLRGVFESLWGSIQQLVPVIGNVSGMFAQASAIIAAVGIETFVESLEAVSGILEASVVPVLQLANSALSGMQPVVVAAIAAWMGFRLVAPALAGVRTQVATLAATATTATGRLTALATANRAIVQTTSMGAVQMGRFGSSIAQVGQSVPLVARMQSSFVNAAAGASSFGRTAGVAAAAGTGLRAAGSGIAGVFGGPVGLALTGAVIAGTAWSASVQRQKQETEAYTTALESLSEAQKSTGQALMESRGAKTEQVYSSLTDQIDQYTSKVDAASAADAKWHNVASDMFGDVFKGMFGADNEDISTRMDDQAGAYQNVKRSLEELGMTNEQLGRTLGGSNAQWDTFTAKLRATGAGGEQAANELQELRDKVISQADIAARVTPGVSELGAAMQKMGEKGASAADKLNALKAAMDAMNPARNKTEALAQYGEAIRKVAEAAHGIDSSAIDQSGQINAMTEAGSALSRTLADLADKSAQVASTGGDMAAVNAQNEEAFGALASATGRSVDEIRSLYNSLGGTAVDLTVRLQGAPEVTQQLAAISAQWNSVPTNKQIEVQESAVNDETRAALQRMNATVSQPMNGTVTITANDDVARSRILLITQNMSVLNAMRANPTLDLNTLSFTAQNQQALQALRTLQAQHPTPQAGMIIDQLLNGQAVSMTKLDELSRTVANPQARMEIEKIMQNIQTVNDALDRVAETRNAQIWVNYTSGNGDWQGLTEQQRADNIARNFQNLAAAQNADGSIRQYLDGGIAAAEAYANGGARLPDRALIQKPNPKGGLVQWAEPETGGEAFIPLAGSKRGRSTDILAAVAKIFGYALVPQDNLPSSISGILGALTGNTIGKLLSLSGVDRYGITAYANGGLDAAGLRKLAEGQGASRPLTGAPYVWGGVNWGDCSGSMSAFARAAVGLDPFGGRFSTATEASQLQAMGFTLGRGSSGDLRFGWYNGGAGGGHTAGTLPDGTKIEMGGGNGGGMLGGSVGADSSQFTEHAYLTIGPAWTDAGTDPGGFVTRPDGTIVYEPGDGNFGATGSGGGGGSSTSGGGTSISSRFGSAVGAFVEGQIADVFQTLGANDTPGIVGAIAEWENARRSDGTVDTAALKKSYDAAVAKSNEQLEKDKAALKADLDAKKITQAEYDSKLAELQKKHDDTLAEAKAKYDEATKTAQSANGAAQQQEQQVPSDPGTSTPAPGEDLGGTGGGTTAGAVASTGSQIKDAFRSGLREAWRAGQPWTDTDWIVNKESSWNPSARNGKYWGLIQAGPEVYEAAGVSPTTTDPAEQAKAYDKYVSGRYTDPAGARAHWEASNWYDDGGVGVGTGLMAKNVIRPERVLSPRQTESFEQMVRRDFQSGVGTDQIIAKLDQLIGAVLSIEGGDTVTLRDEREYYERKQRRQQARIAAAAGGR